MVYRAYIVCSDNRHLEPELNYLRKVFHNFNSYQNWFVIEVKNDFDNQIISPTPHTETTDGESNNIRKAIMILPYAGEKECTLFKSLKKSNSSQHRNMHNLYWGYVIISA